MLFVIILVYLLPFGEVLAWHLKRQAALNVTVCSLLFWNTALTSRLIYFDSEI